MSDCAEAAESSASHDSSTGALGAPPEAAGLARPHPSKDARPSGRPAGGETPPLQRPFADARAGRLAKFEREQLIVDSLNRGVSVAEIAARMDVSEKRMRAIIREVLARRMPHAPEEFAAIQVSRLNEALLVAYSAMTDMNLKAVDRVVRIVRELDRYHGFSAASRRLPESSRLEAPVEGTMTFGAALVCRPEFAPQDAENVESAPDIPDPVLSKDAPDVTNVAGRRSRLRAATVCAAPQHEAQGFPIAGSTPDDRPGFPPQHAEKIDSAPGITTAAEAASPVETPPKQDASADIVRSGREDAGRALSAAGSGPADRPENPAQRFENMESAPKVAIVFEAEGVAHAERAPASAIGRPGSGQDVLAPHASPDDRSENPPQDAGNVESAPGYGRPAEASSSGGASDVGPAFQNPIGFRPIKVRMTLNGVMTS